MGQDPTRAQKTLAAGGAPGQDRCMQAKDLMCREPRAVRMYDRLDAAARVMWEHDCGLCPVVDASGVLVGVPKPACAIA